MKKILFLMLFLISILALAVISSANDSVPVGTIAMWSGSLSSIPDGWQICDGTNGTANLSGKFIVGYNASDSDYDAIGKQGGEKTHQLTVDELAGHNHVIFSMLQLVVANTAGRTTGAVATVISITNNYVTGYTEYTGSNVSHENRPPYYTLAYIQKINTPCNCSVTVLENLVNATGTNQTSYNSTTGWTIWNNYTGNTTSINLFQNILNAAGTHEYQLGSTGYAVWANYTGNTSTAGAPLVVDNPNPANGTMGYNYIHYANGNSSNGIITAVDVAFNNFTVNNETNFGSGVVYESSTAESIYQSIYDVFWYAQTFTVGNTGTNESFILNKVQLKLLRAGSPGTFTVSIKNVDAVTGKPTGDDLSSASINGNTLSTSYALVNISLNPITIEKGGRYAIVCRAPSGDGSNYINWREKEAVDTYAGGQGWDSWNSGLDWTFVGAGNSDFVFYVYGWSIGGNITYNHIVNVSFQSNSSGSWVEYYNTSISMNSTVSFLNTDFNQFSTTYWWRWFANSTSDSANRTVQFTTGINTTQIIALDFLVHNPNPGNGTNDYNYLKNNSQGINTSVDVKDGNYTESLNLMDTYYEPGEDEYRGVWTDGTYVYIAQSGDGISALRYNKTTASFDYLATQSDGGEYYDVWGDGTYIFVATGSTGVSAYTFDGTSFTFIDSNTWKGGDYRGVWGDGTYIYLCGVQGTDGMVIAYSFDGGSFTKIDSQTKKNIPFSGISGKLDVGETFVYIAGGFDGLFAYSFDGATLTFVTSQADFYEGSYFGVWTDGNYVYASASGFLYAYTFDGVTFTLITYAGGGDFTNSWGDGTYIYASEALSGINCYVFNGTDFILKSESDDGGKYNDVWGDGEYTYVACGSSGVRAYTVGLILKFYSNTSGSWEQYGTWHRVYNDSTINELNINMTQPSTQYWWMVNWTSWVENGSKMFWFETAPLSITPIILLENILNATGTHEYQLGGSGYTVWANYTGYNGLLVLENLVNATGTNQTHWNGTAWTVWNNYTGNTTAIHISDTKNNVSGDTTYLLNGTGYWVNSTHESQTNLLENIVSATGTHQQQWDGTFWNVWANYTGTTTPLTLNENIVESIGTHEYNLDGSGYHVWANYTGFSHALNIIEQLINATGSYGTSYNNITGWDVWNNYTGDTTPITLLENILSATGTHQYQLGNTGYTIWANYTGDTTPVTLHEDITNATGTNVKILSGSGWDVYANYTGLNGLLVLENLVNATGTNQTYWNGTSWTVWNNYTGTTTPITLFENINKATGSHEYALDGTGYSVWANYTGDTTPVTLHETIVNASGSLTKVLSGSGWDVYADYAGYNGLSIFEHLINATGGYQKTWDGTSWNVWNNYTGTTTPITLFENIFNVTGTHEYYLNETGYQVYANYSGNATNKSSFMVLGMNQATVLSSGSIAGLITGTFGFLVFRRKRKRKDYNL